MRVCASLSSISPIRRSIPSPVAADTSAGWRAAGCRWLMLSSRSPPPPPPRAGSFPTSLPPGRPRRRLPLAHVVQPLALARVDAVDLVPHLDQPGVAGLDAELAQRVLDVLRLRLGVEMRDVAHVQDDVRLD